MDKLVNGLSDRLAKLDGNSSDSDSNNGEGRNYWKGRKIIPSDDWLKISKAKMSPSTVDNVLEGIQYFPDDFIRHLWALGIPHDEKEPAIIEAIVHAWYSEYIELMIHRKNPGYELELLKKSQYNNDNTKNEQKVFGVGKACG